MLVPATQSIRTPASSRAARTPTWARPRAPPPLNTRPTRGRPASAGPQSPRVGAAAAARRASARSPRPTLAAEGVEEPPDPPRIGPHVPAAHAAHRAHVHAAARALRTDADDHVVLEAEPARGVRGLDPSLGGHRGHDLPALFLRGVERAVERLRRRHPEDRGLDVGVGLLLLGRDLRPAV